MRWEAAAWERRALNTRAPSRPEFWRQDPRKWIFCPNFAKFPSRRRFCPSQVFPAGWVLTPGVVHTTATITASSKPWKIRQLGLCVCAASQYLNARENCWSLGQSVKIGQNCMVGQFYRAFPDIICRQNLVAAICSAPKLAFSSSL